MKNNKGCQLLAISYRFDLTNKELIMDYLFNKVHENPFPFTTIVKECDDYGDNRVWKGLFEAIEENTLYSFTRLKKKTEKGKIIDSLTDSSTYYIDDDDDGRAPEYGGSNDDVSVAMRESNFQTHHEHTKVTDSSSNNNLNRTISKGGKITHGYMACGDSYLWSVDEFQFGRDGTGMCFKILTLSHPAPLKI
ncbi:hypothetical protein Ddye_026010 [Dipteronia dyeriana]|uniref:NAC domain-containing protein n=1 Tax=Dipteronia dyeriana TaxID=168575 RepID=A0AAD9TMH2_9ROSI|nr:hypothetical protein Ddye_026010 [Dipteronia dyeriana]